MGEIVLIAVVALLVLGPERLPGAAKAIGKGIRELRSQTKQLQNTIEADTQLGDAVREIRGAFRGDPETLYQKVTGTPWNEQDDDWKSSDSAPKVADSGDDAESTEEPSDSEEQVASAEKDENSSVHETTAEKHKRNPLSAPPNFDQAYANANDNWGKAPVNPHVEATPDPDLPVIEAAQGTMARNEPMEDADLDSGSDTKPEHV